MQRDYVLVLDIDTFDKVNLAHGIFVVVIRPAADKRYYPDSHFY